MSFFSEQKFFCAICGEETQKTLGHNTRTVCGDACRIELDWRVTLSILGKPYNPQPTRGADKESPGGN